MALPTEKGIDPPQSFQSESWNNYWIPWIKRLADAFPKTGTYTELLTPTSVAANTTNEQSFTVNGLSTNDVVVVNKPTFQTGLGIAGAIVSSLNTLSITYVNSTAGAIVPTTETYKIISTRL